VYSPWSGALGTPRKAACLRYQQKNSKTGAPLEAWTYSAIDLAACNQKTGKPVGNTYNSIAVESTVMCCAEPDCNSPNPQLDTLTITGPTITQALLQQDPAFDVNTIKRVYKGEAAADGELVPLPRIVQRPTNGNTGVVYNMAGANVDANEQANSMLEYQLLESGVMPMGADGYAPGSYGGYGDAASATFGSQTVINVSPTPATSAGDNSASTLEEGQYTTTSPLATSSSATAQASTAAAAASSTKTSGAGTVQTSLTAVSLLAAGAAALALLYSVRPPWARLRLSLQLTWYLLCHTARCLSLHARCGSAALLLLYSLHRAVAHAALALNKHAHAHGAGSKVTYLVVRNTSRCMSCIGCIIMRTMP
jgi:hypothetical protein